MVSQTLRDQLDVFVARHFPPEARVYDFRESDGHAGLTFLFAVEHAAGRREQFVLKIPPKGVKRRGNTDVYRQAPLLRTLHAAGLPVPDVPYASPDEDVFGVPYIVMQRLPGHVFFVWDPPAVFERTEATAVPLWQQCADALVEIHNFDWREPLANWDQPELLHAQVRRWEKIYRHAEEEKWVTMAAKVQQLLLDKLPDGQPIGLFHGDYQPGNCLYEDQRLCGIIDWELSGIGARLLDIGWLMMAADYENWCAAWRPVCAPPPQELRETYEAGMGQSYPDIPWYNAFAGFRLASIACLNVKLHRSGQRHDPIWECMAQCIVPMYARARHILESITA